MSLELPNISSLSLESTTSSPIRYFDLLPPELVRQIVRDVAVAVVRDPDGVSIYRSDRDRLINLRALCLVSTRFRLIAQPILLSAVYISTTSLDLHGLAVQKQVELLVDRNSLEALSVIRTLDIWRLYKEDSFPATHFRKLAQAVVSLETLHCGWSVAQFVPFVGSNIVTLYIQSIDFSSISVLSLPRLKYLYMEWCYVGGGGGGGDKIRFELPSLRHLQYSAKHDNLSAFDIAFLEAVAPTLTSFTISFEELPVLPAAITSNPHFLKCHRPQHMDYETCKNISPVVEHLRLYCRRWTEGVTYPGLDTEVDSLMPLLSDNTKLKTLILYPNVLSAELSIGDRESISELLELCRCKGVRVIWEDWMPDEIFWGQISPWFIRYAEKEARGSRF